MADQWSDLGFSPESGMLSCMVASFCFCETNLQLGMGVGSMGFSGAMGGVSDASWVGACIGRGYGLAMR